MAKWQDVKKLLIGSGIGVITLLSALFLLTGVEYTHSGDIVCGETCESYINVTTTYWRICFDSYDGTKYEDEILFKKQARSRTLHVNLDKVDNIITTEPNVKVDWMVPTYGNQWRLIKGGDCWERGKVNKIKLVGHKESSQTVKWSFDLGSKVNIDPIWKSQSNITYTSSTDKNCNNGKCNLILYSGIKNVYEDETWKRVENVRSLRGSGIECVVDSDGENLVECLDWNMTSIKLKFSQKSVSMIDKEVPIKIYEKNETGDLVLKSETKESFSSLSNEKEKILSDFEYGNIIHFGEKSTTIILKEPNTENLEDTTFGDYDYSGTGPDENVGNHNWLSLMIEAPDEMHVLIKYSISSIPPGVTIEEARTYLVGENYLDSATEGWNVSVHHHYNLTWIETYPTLNNFANLGPYNTTKEDDLYVFGGAGEPVSPFNWNVTNMISTAYNNNEDNITIYFQSHDGFGNPYHDALDIFSKEENDNDLRPYLNITYSEAGAVDINYSVALPLGVIRFLNCSPDWEYFSQPDGQTATIAAINATNNGTVSGSFTINLTGALNTNWTIWASNDSLVTNITLSTSAQTIWSGVAANETKKIWLGANCSYVSANPGQSISMWAI